MKKRTFPLFFAVISLLLFQSAQAVVPQDDDWSQEAHDAQRTGYTPIEPEEPWELAWMWNAADSNGGTDGHFYDAGRGVAWTAHSVAGGDFIYVPALNEGLYALNKADGTVVWNIKPTTFFATPAYADGYVYAGGEDGVLYKVNASDGTIEATYGAASPLNEALLLADNSVYAAAENGTLHKVAIDTMAASWVYDAEADTQTPPSYSAQHDTIVFATDDLYIHAVNNADGTQKWAVKPTPHEPSEVYNFEGFWPVIAEQHGIVFIRLNLGNNYLWADYNGDDKYPETNEEIRNYILDEPGRKNLFALDLETGEEAFYPAVGYGGVEGLIDGGYSLMSGPPPVIKTLDDGNEVAYSYFRNGQLSVPNGDGRWDTHIGEMMLDDQTIPGYLAGDMRFIEFPKSFTRTTDEQTPITMAGDTIFRSHWGAMESTKIRSRSASRGLIQRDPITTEPHPTVIRRIVACDDFDPVTHWTRCDLELFGDTRGWAGPGWWVYWDVHDPPTPLSGSYSEGLTPRYTYVTGDLIIVHGNGGDIFALRHSGA